MGTKMKALFSATDRISYRRLLAFVTATGLLIGEKLADEQWVYVCVAFIAAEAGPKMIDSLVKVKRGS